MSASISKSVVDLGNGVKQVTYASGKRYYEVNGQKMPSVTTILGILDKPALIYWAVNCYHDYLAARAHNYDELLVAIETGKQEFRNVSQEAKDVGTLVHDAIEVYMLTGMEPSGLTGQAEAGFRAYLEWEREHKLERIKTEVPIYSLKHGYAGTSDMICRLDENPDLFLVDFKTSKAIYGEYYLQIAAYREAYNETSGDSLKINRVGILRLDKETGMPEFDSCLNRKHAVDFKRFSLLCEYYKLTKALEAEAKLAAKAA